MRLAAAVALIALALPARGGEFIIQNAPQPLQAKKVPTYVLVTREWRDHSMFCYGSGQCGSAGWENEARLFDDQDAALNYLRCQAEAGCKDRDSGTENENFIGLWHLGEPVKVSLAKKEHVVPKHVEIEEEKWTEYDWHVVGEPP